MTRGIEKLTSHVVICGFGRNGQILAESLERQGRKFVIVDNDPLQVDEAKSKGYLTLVGDATEDETLLEAGIKRAKTLVTGLPNDSENVFITLTTRNLCPTIQIIARAEQPSTEKKLRQAGANKIVMPAVIGAHQMVRMITRPSTADLMEFVSESNFIDVDLDEIQLTEGCGLIDVRVRDTQSLRTHRLLVVAVKHREGAMTFNPGADYTFQVDDIVIMMGRHDDIELFRKMYRV